MTRLRFHGDAQSLDGATDPAPDRNDDDVARRPAFRYTRQPKD